MSGKRLNAAYENLDVVRELAGSDPEINAMRDRLVRAYVDRAKEQHAAGKVNEAKQSAAKARELAPNSPVTAELQNLL